MFSYKCNSVRSLKVYDSNGKPLNSIDIQLLYLEINILFLTQFIKNLDRVRFGVNLNKELFGLIELLMKYSSFSIPRGTLDLSSDYRYKVNPVKSTNLNDLYMNNTGPLPVIFFLNNKDFDRFLKYLHFKLS